MKAAGVNTVRIGHLCWDTFELEEGYTPLRCNGENVKFNVFKAMINFVKNRHAVGTTLAAMGMFLGMKGGTGAVTVLFQSCFTRRLLQPCRKN